MSNPFNPYAAPQVEQTLAPGVQWVRGGSASLQQTATGLGLVYYGIVLILLAIPIALLGAVAGVAAKAAGPAVAILLLAGLSALVGFILLIVGPLVCLAVPAETGAKGLIIGSVVLQLSNIAYAVLTAVMKVPVPPAVQAILQLLGLVAFVLFVLFMKALAEYIARLDLAARAKTILVVLGIFVGEVVLMILGALAGSAVLAGVLAFAYLITALILLVMYANLINILRKALVGQA